MPLTSTVIYHGNYMETWSKRCVSLNTNHSRTNRMGKCLSLCPACIFAQHLASHYWKQESRLDRDAWSDPTGLLLCNHRMCIPEKAQDSCWVPGETGNLCSEDPTITLVQFFKLNQAEAALVTWVSDDLLLHGSGHGSLSKIRLWVPYAIDLTKQE